MTIKYLVYPPIKANPIWHVAAIETTTIFGTRVLGLEICPTEELVYQWIEWTQQYTPWREPAGLYTFVPVARHELERGHGPYYDTAMRVLRERKQEGTLSS